VFLYVLSVFFHKAALKPTPIQRIFKPVKRVFFHKAALKPRKTKKNNILTA